MTAIENIFSMTVYTYKHSVVLPLTPWDLPHEKPTGVTNIVRDLCVALDNAARICCPKIVDLCGKPHIN